MSFYVARASRRSIPSLGFSIVELLVAMAISLLLLAGVLAIFTSSRASYETTDRTSKVQENGRFALDQLSRQIRSAGFVGCARQPTYVSNTLRNTGKLQWNFLQSPVMGYNWTSANTWTPALDASIVSAADKGDVLVLRVPARDAEPLRLTADMTSGTDDLTVPDVTTGVKQGDVALAYSCEAQAYFYVSGFSGGKIQHAATAGADPANASANLNFNFRTNAEVIPVQTVIYYIRTSSGAGTALPAGTTSLWRQVGANAAEELVEGVERMELEFGIDTNGDTIVDSYQTANNVTNWGNVSSVSIALLVRSLQPYGSDLDKRSYTLLSQTVSAPNDRYLREVFTTTAALRNRIRVN
jgi:type IV pilus assembly protein PilW